MRTADQHTYRYPGMRAFERSETQLFYGREQECYELYNQVKVQQLTVLFAKSGIGKSSLINAGLLPLLEEDFFYPVKIRLQDTSVSPVETVKNILQSRLDSDLFDRRALGEAHLWEYLRACQFTAEDGTEQTPVFIFDQFEEFFNHAPQERQAFLENLADLINKRLPGSLQQGLRQVPRNQRDDEILNWYSPIPCRVVLAIRSDRISQLDSLKERIPTILHHRYQLQPLMASNARQAIIEPALLASEHFTSPPFQYSEDALDVMLESLANQEGEIESFQLQILCQHIEQTIDPAMETIVKPTDFGGAEGLQNILNTYYERQIGALAPEEQSIARRFIEEGLIIDGQRVGIPAGEEERRYNVSAELLSKLLDSRLVRTETIHLGQIYELSHDTLVEPITKSYYARREEEEKETAKRELSEERERVALANRKKQRAYVYAAIAGGLALLAAFAGIWALRSKRVAEDREQEARVATLANKAWDVFKDDNTLALRLAEAAYQLDTTNEQARTTLYNIINNRNCTFYQAACGQREEQANNIMDVSFSHDGQWLATAEWNANIRIWDKQGNLQQTFYGLNFGVDTFGHSGILYSLAFSPAAPLLATAGVDRVVKIWDIANGQHLRDFPVWNRSQINDLAFSPDGNLLLTGSRDSTANIWTIDGTQKALLSGHASGVRAVAFSPDGQMCLSGDEKGYLYFWTIDGTLIRRIGSEGPSVNAVRFSPDGRTILVGRSNNTASLLELSGEIQATFGGHTAEIVDVGFSPDGQKILTASADGKAKLWTLAGEEILTFSGHQQQLTSASFSADGQFLATGSYDQTAKVWDIDFNLKQRRELWHTGAINAIRVSPDGQTIATASADQSIKLWNQNGQYLSDLIGHTDNIVNIAFSPEGDLLASGGYDRTIRIWQPDGECLAVLEGHIDAVNKLDFSPDGSLLLSCGGGRDGTIRLWNTTTMELIRTWVPHSGVSVRSIQFSPDGQSILSCGHDNLAILWSIDGLPIDTFDNFGVPVYTAQFSPEGEQLITAGNEYPVKTWQTTGELSQINYGHFHEVYNLSWTPDGTKFASASFDHSAIIWSTDGQILHRLPHPDAVYDVSFSPDGQQLLTASRDQVGRIWSVETGDLQLTLSEYSKPQTMTSAAAVAKLAAIPFSLADYDISLSYAPLLFANNREGLIRQAQELTFQANGQSALFEKSYALYQQAIRLLTPHMEDNDALSTLTYTYEKQTDHLLRYQRFNQALGSAADGLDLAPETDYLLIFEILSLIYTDQIDLAVEKYQALEESAITQIPFYSTFPEAISGELWWFETQYGIITDGVAVFKERTGVE